MTTNPTLAIIGGSGLYDMEGLENTEQVSVKTPFGDPSAPITLGDLEGQRVAFLARHGIGHRLNPGEVNYRANIYALKSLGVARVVGVSACGSLREAYAPGHIVIPDQLFDFTKDRERTFFSGGMVAHIDTAEPFCAETSQQAYDAVAKTGATVHQGGTFITIEGPRFSTKAESHLFRQWGMDIIGMTTSPEAYLAREAELCYAVIGHVTDYDVWHVSEEPVTVEMVIKTLNRNTEIAQQAVRNLARDLKPERECACRDALATAFITNPDVIPAETRQRLSLLVDKYL
jgi:5'-methylthioadenosine phosphorylase